MSSPNITVFSLVEKGPLLYMKVLVPVALPCRSADLSSFVVAGQSGPAMLVRPEIAALLPAGGDQAADSNCSKQEHPGYVHGINGKAVRQNENIAVCFSLFQAY
jgi:hypothetical protein